MFGTSKFNARIHQALQIQHTCNFLSDFDLLLFLSLSDPFPSTEEESGFLENIVDALEASGMDDMSLSCEDFSFFAFLIFFPLPLAAVSESLQESSSVEF